MWTCHKSFFLFLFLWSAALCENSLWSSCFSKDGYQKQPPTTSLPYKVIIKNRSNQVGQTSCVHIWVKVQAQFLNHKVWLPEVFHDHSVNSSEKYECRRPSHIQVCMSGCLRQPHISHMWLWSKTVTFWKEKIDHLMRL